MDIKEIIAKVEEKLGDDAFKAELKTNPIKAVEDLVGIKLSEDQIKEVTEFVKAKIGAKEASGFIAEAEEKIEGLLGGILGKK